MICLGNISAVHLTEFQKKMMQNLWKIFEKNEIDMAKVTC